MNIIDPDTAHPNVVVGNGEFPTAQRPLEVIGNATYIACCDAGADKYIAAKAKAPDLIIGDGDSLSEENMRRYANRFIKISEQETNDQTKAVKHLIQAGRKAISIVGATGKREDHTLGNISLLIDYMHMGAEVNMFTNHGIFVPCHGGTMITCSPGQKVSFFNFSCRRLTARGVEYRLRPFNNWWQGTLNRCTSSRIEIAADGDYLIFLNYAEP